MLINGICGVAKPLASAGKDGDAIAAIVIGPMRPLRDVKVPIASTPSVIGTAEIRGGPSGICEGVIGTAEIGGGPGGICEAVPGIGSATAG